MKRPHATRSQSALGWDLEPFFSRPLGAVVGEVNLGGSNALARAADRLRFLHCTGFRDVGRV